MVNSLRKRVLHSIGRYGRNQTGVTSIEYALIASLIAIAIMVGVAAAGNANAFNWSTWTGKVVGAIQKALGS